MSIPTHISRVVINVGLDVLFPLFLTAAGGNREAACQAAMDLLADYNPNTAEELGLASEIIAFRLKALGCLRDSDHPGTPHAARLDLLKIAATLRRNETAAQRKLDALQRARRAAAKKADAKPQAAAPQPLPPAATVTEPAAETPPVRAAAPVPQPRPAPARAAASAAPSRIDAFVQRLTADLTGNGNDQPGSNAMLADIAAAFRAGDHRGVLNAAAGPRSAVSASALLGAA